MKKPEIETSEDQLLDHDTAEDLAYAQKPYIDIAHIALKEMQKLELGMQPQRSEHKQSGEDLNSNDVPEEVKQRSVLTTTQAAVYLGVSRPHLIHHYLDTGKLGYFKVGRDRRIRFSDLEKFRDELYVGNV